MPDLCRLSDTLGKHVSRVFPALAQDSRKKTTTRRGKETLATSVRIRHNMQKQGRVSATASGFVPSAVESLYNFFSKHFFLCSGIEIGDRDKDVGRKKSRPKRTKVGERGPPLSARSRKRGGGAKKKRDAYKKGDGKKGGDRRRCQGYFARKSALRLSKEKKTVKGKNKRKGKNGK